MPKYFKFLPKVNYQTRQIVDISRRVKVLDKFQNNPYLYLPYTITQDDKPEDIAHLYYGDVGKVWMIFLANNILDPYNEWPKPDDVFEKYLAAKYEDQYRASTGDTSENVEDAVFFWTQNQTITDNIVRINAEYDTGEQIEVNVQTYENLLYTDLTYVEQSYFVPTFDDDSDANMIWTPYRIYDYEYDRNQSLRSIQLINKAFADQVESELKKLMKNAR